MFNEGRVALRAFTKTQHYKWIRFIFSVSEPGSGESGIDDFRLGYPYSRILFDK